MFSSYGESIDTDRRTVEARKDRVKNFSTISRTNAICTRRDPTLAQRRAGKNLSFLVSISFHINHFYFVQLYLTESNHFNYYLVV